ncbi:AB hydrolase superfamily protein YdjP [Cytospora mali]|uniref:AB hydrolase superfamily protein YdjP n=1 Tax=Cytospora mali TaxID=578113 RepID=A0A194UW57_CYTMA|nr:AB hydrolase superfamily protein YdjP [Valsa mali var. pyri (nom. inval.)]
MASSSTPTTGFISTNDGVRLAYTQTGPSSGQEILFIPGWRQTAAQWRKQVSHFQTAHHVTTYDHRGHGGSDKPSFGHRVHRYAADLLDLLTQLKLSDVHIVGHSMGCSIVWAFFDIFPSQARALISGLVLVDQSPCMTADPAWTPEQARQVAAVFTPGIVSELGRDMQGSTAGLISVMFTGGATAEDRDWTLRQSSLMSDENAAALLQNHASMDWRDVLPRLDIPALVIAAEGSVCPAEGVRWMGEQIPGAKVVTFSKEEGGSHFMFLENPARFNTLVEEFVNRSE